MATHLVARRVRNDGQWVAECTCGWRSRQAIARELLGWSCPVERSGHDCGETCSSCPECYQSKNLEICGRACEHATEN
jgi:hypothetical protein